MITVTDRAVSKLKELLAEQDEAGLYFGDVRVLVDKTSSRLLDGAEIDYVSSVTAAGFAIRNPNAVSTCGCGHSFKTRDDAGEAQPCSETEETRA
jgi:iron-sulfur cluster assembly protein